jgi:superfamily II DNA or RNA helicase
VGTSAVTQSTDGARARLDAARAELAASAALDGPTATLGSIVLRPDQIVTVRRVRVHLRNEGGCLLADDVGTGKTYVALAVAREWSRPLVVHPASLRATWEHAARRAGVRCGFISHEALSRGGAVDHSFDGVVVDESHRFRPTSRRHAALAAITSHATVVMLSATPLQNRARELAAQLAMFLGEIAYLLPADELARRVVRSASSHDVPLPRVAPARWLAIDADDGDVLRAILALPPPPRASDAGDGGVLLQLSLVRAWASSRAALTAAVRRRQHVLAAMEQCHQEGRRPTRRELCSWSGGVDIQLGFATLLAASSIHARDHAALGLAIEREREGLGVLLHTIANAADPDPMRVAALLGLRRAHADDAILAFSESASTVRAHWSAMRGETGVGLLTAREARIASGRVTRDELLARFSPRAQGARSPAAHERVTLLLTTDLLSEGVNLQDASVVVHLDLPWNPARLAQRLGRIRRPGGASEVASYLLSPPAHASLLLRTEARLRAKLTRAESIIGRGVDVLPALSAPTLVSAHISRERAAHVEAGSSLSAAELRGEVARRLARWRRTDGPGDAPPDGVDGRVINAAVRADAHGWIALLDDSRLVASVTDGDRHAQPGEAPDLIVRALELLEGAACHPDDAERDRAHRELAEWIMRDWTRCSSGLAAAESPMRRRMRRALDEALQALPRHRRGAMFDRAARVRDALARPLPLGLERALDALVETHATNGDWLETAAALVARAPACIRDPAMGAPRCRVLILFGGSGVRLVRESAASA